MRHPFAKAVNAVSKPEVNAVFWNNPIIRAWLYQLALVGGCVYLLWQAINNAATNMAAHGIPTGFDFWNRVAGFDINQSLIAYSSQSSYGQAFWVGLINTFVVAIISIIFATIVGFIIGIGRLSHNWMIARLSTFYVEIIRNIPLLLQLLFWYNAVLKPLPAPRQSLSLFGVMFLNNRGLILPDIIFTEHAAGFFIAFGVGVLVTLLFVLFARHYHSTTGLSRPVWPVAFACLIGFPLIAAGLLGTPFSIHVPHLQGFNFDGGMRILPECVALILGLSLYTASFIAEIVRAGIQSVPKGQIEAAASLGLRRSFVMHKIIIPQAMRVIVPPLTNQFLNLTKNSSLAVFIGYPDLVQVFMGTVLNQTGAAVQVIAITMLIYLALSLLTSVLMSLVNRRWQLRER
jgi:general L-amino acid transport system permease protein